MNLFAKLNDPKHWRELPTVWVRRLVIHDGTGNDPIQNVSLKPGMNIVWGRETKETATNAFQPGHGLGKTTFCRLIRFCLGEESFGQPRTVAGVQNDFPNGYVDAIVEVGSKTWCVRRHFAGGHSSFARQAKSLSSFVRRPPSPDTDPYASFHNHVAAVTLGELDEKQFLAGEKSFRWKHLLAMCSRDQEARYVDPLQWRSKRSTAELPAFAQPKADAIRCVLALLGIYTDKDRELDDREQTLKKRINKLQQRKSKGETRLEYWEDHHRETLSKAGVEEAEGRSMDATSLFALEPKYRDVHDKLVAEIAALDQQITELEIQVSYAAASLKERREARQVKEGAAETIRSPAEEAIEERSRLAAEWTSTLQTLKELKFTLCEYGNESIGKCVHAQDYARELEEALTSLPVIDPDEPNSQIDLAENLEATATRLQESEARVADEMRKIVEQKQTAERKRRRKEREQEDIENAWKELERIESARKDTSVDKSLSKVTNQLADAESDLEQAKTERKQATKMHQRQLSDLEAAFDVLVKRCITDEYEGTIRLSEDDLTFQILHGETGSGEGFEMLAILLGDLALAILGAARMSTHPGLLIHDSPREADLGPLAYQHYLTNIQDVFGTLACDQGIPIQYIVTTTTPPPKPLRPKAHTPLKLGGKAGMLFGKPLKTARPRLVNIPYFVDEKEREPSQ
ncbi:coiled-coil domain-containing protein [Rhodopirellula sallentina]|uniref:Chromosome segregation SMC protein n=1 Tax=Rhodopirellula sallentina SM41 TaxID=1263870 RepID=M5UAW4_9BACT|nr:chromosome segregation SMC protein [Rhodopirellula sallentina]EMI54986.1 chromosome segregation SMC protein [Rhodopirellula sallentina SM41]